MAPAKLGPDLVARWFSLYGLLDLAGDRHVGGHSLKAGAHDAQADKGPALPAHRRLALGQGADLRSEAGLRDLAAQPEN